MFLSFLPPPSSLFASNRRWQTLSSTPVSLYLPSPNFRGTSGRSLFIPSTDCGVGEPSHLSPLSLPSNPPLLSKPNQTLNLSFHRLPSPLVYVYSYFHYFGPTFPQHFLPTCFYFLPNVEHFLTQADATMIPDSDIDPTKIRPKLLTLEIDPGVHDEQGRYRDAGVERWCDLGTVR